MFELCTLSPEDQELFIEIVSRLGYPVKHFIFDNGLSLLQNLENLEIILGLPKLVVLDINMPTWGGVQTLTALRRLTKYNAVPIIMYTTSLSPGDKKTCLELGANDFITKPNLERDFKIIAEKFRDYIISSC